VPAVRGAEAVSAPAAPLEKAVSQAEQALQNWRDSPLTGMAHVPQATRDDAALLYNTLRALLAALDADKMVMMVREQADELERCAAAMHAAGTELDSLRLALAEAERQRDELESEVARLRSDTYVLTTARNAALTLAEQRGAAYDIEQGLRTTAERERDEATDTALRHLTERDDWFAAYQRTEALRLEAVQGMVAAERERDEARAEVAKHVRERALLMNWATDKDGNGCDGCHGSTAGDQNLMLLCQSCGEKYASLSRARETDGAVREAAERLWYKLTPPTSVTENGCVFASAEDIETVLRALSSPPRPETKADDKGGAA